MCRLTLSPQQPQAFRTAVPCLLKPSAECSKRTAIGAIAICDPRTAKQPQRKAFAWVVPWTSGRISGQTSWPKNFHAIARGAENKVCCADVLDPKARTSMTVSERLYAGKLRADFSFPSDFNHESQNTSTLKASASSFSENSRKLQLSISTKHGRKAGIRFRAVSTQGSLQVCLSWCLKSLKSTAYLGAG